MKETRGNGEARNAEKEGIARSSATILLANAIHYVVDNAMLYHSENPLLIKELKDRGQLMLDALPSKVELRKL
jgi:hypothetical protein